MRFCDEWFMIFIVFNLCTCGGRTECINKSKLAVLANLQSNKCKNNLNNNFLSQENDDNLLQKYNFNFEGLSTETLLLDTCGRNEETLKNIFKTIMWADINCLFPPYFLGLIGPENSDNLNVSLKITSALEIPHIVFIPSIATNSHRILPATEAYIVEGIFTLLEIFKWKSFYFRSNMKSNVIKNIAQHFITKATARKYCFMSNKEDATNFIFLGKPDENFLNDLFNSSIIIVNDENIEKNIKNQNNTFLILDNLITNLDKADSKSKEYQLWLENNMPISNEKVELLSVPDAMKIYIKALNSLCKNQNCYINRDFKQWNQLIANTAATFNREKEKKNQFLIFKIKDKIGPIKSLGRIKYYNSNIEIYWDDEVLSTTRNINQMKTLNDLKNFFITPEMKSSCDQNILNNNQLNNEGTENHKTTVIITEITDSEWWTMVGTVAGVGIAMFAVGFFAVYVVYTNIRGPKFSKASGKEDLDRDSSLRRVGSDRQNSSNTGRSVRVINGLQRRDSRSSIRSNISDKSV